MKNNNAPFKRINKDKNADNLAKSLSSIESKLFETDIKGNIKDGFSSTDGSWQRPEGGSNWYSFWVDVEDVRTFTITHETKANFSIRLVMLDNKGAVISRVMIPKGDFTVSDDCVRFAVNFPTPNSQPTLPLGATLFADIADVNGMKIVKKDLGVLDRIKKEVLEIPVIDHYTETKTTFVVGEGYYASSSGVWNLGVNWLSTSIPTLGSSSITMKHADSTNARIIYYVDDNFHSSAIVNTNTKLPLPKGCNKVTFNFMLANSTPKISGMTEYASKAKVEEIQAYLENPVYTNQTVTQRIDSIVNNTPKTVKILSIGNSFSEDGQTMLYDIAKSAGIELILGNLYMGGQTLEGHWTQVSGNLSNYTYQKRTATGRKDTANSSMKSGIIDEAWDIITFQQGSDYSGIYTSYQPYLNDLITYVKGLATNADVKFAWHMTWPYASTSTHANFDKYDKNTLTMYNGIVDATLKAMQETNISILIPNGTAVQNARTNSYLMAVGTEMSRDGYHMDYGIGRYVVGLGYFQALLGGLYHKDVLADVTYMPTNNGATPFLGYLAKVAVRNANINPFKITAI